jgi:peptide deformylase
LELTKDLSGLYSPTHRWNASTPAFDIVPVAEEMVKLMHDKKGFGLAANQVGLPWSFFAMRGGQENFFMINPRIVNAEGEMLEDLEGCLSYPGLAIKQERFLSVRVRFMGPNGETYTKVFTGLSARIIQHEMDHLEGRPWWHVSKLKFDIAKKKAHTRGWDYKSLTFKGV